MRYTFYHLVHNVLKKISGFSVILRKKFVVLKQNFIKAKQIC